MRSLPACLLIAALLPSAAFAVFGDEDHDITTPVVREIVLEGDYRTHDDLILKEMGVRIGEPLGRERMNEVWIHLEDIGWFAFVDMEFDDSVDGEVILRVYLEDDLTLTYGPLLRFDRRHKYQLGAWLEETNLRGRGEKLRLELAGLYPQRGLVEWSHPWLLGQKGLLLDATLEGEASDFVYRPTRQKWARGSIGLRQDFPIGFFAEAGAAYQSLEFRDAFSWDDRRTGQPVDHEPATMERTAWTVSLGHDSRSNPWYPASGLLARIDWSRWNGDGFADYDEGEADLRLFYPSPLPFGEHIVALRAWGRRVSGPAPLDRFLFFGGPETLRGYRYAGWEGDEGYLLSVEYRIPLFIMPISPRGESVGLGLHLFGDAGDTWFQEEDPGRALQSWGGGAHLNLDTMQLRFEAARTRDGDWVFEFMDHFNF